jgi:hypothetical protein
LRWKIITKKGREIEIEAQYLTESEVRMISALLDAIFEELENNYIIEFEFQLPGGGRSRAQGKFKRGSSGGGGG